MDEFLNADALKNIEQNDIMKELSAMKDAFNKGDLNEALKAAQRLTYRPSGDDEPDEIFSSKTCRFIVFQYA